MHYLQISFAKTSDWDHKIQKFASHISTKTIARWIWGWQLTYMMKWLRSVMNSFYSILCGIFFNYDNNWKPSLKLEFETPLLITSSQSFITNSLKTNKTYSSTLLSFKNGNSILMRAKIFCNHKQIKYQFKVLIYIIFLHSFKCMFYNKHIWLL